MEAPPLTDFVACAATEADKALAELRSGSIAGTPGIDWCAHRGPGDFYPFEQVGRENAVGSKGLVAQGWELRGSDI